jgi:hypothetical protein
MIHKGDPQFPNPPRHGAPHAALLNRRALLAGPAAVLRTKALHAAAAEPRSLVLSLAGAAQVTPRNVPVTPVLFNGRGCVEVRLSGDYPRAGPGLRRDAPARYESYVDVAPAQWTRIRIEVSGSRAELFVGEAAQPVLIVTDLKRGAQARGTVGLYVDNGTDGHFCNLRITPR